MAPGANDPIKSCQSVFSYRSGAFFCSLHSQLSLPWAEGKADEPHNLLRASSPTSPFFSSTCYSNNFFIYFPLHSPHSEHTGLLVIAPTCPESSCLRTFALLRRLLPQ